MTTVSTIITDAYRESNLVSQYSTPNATEVAEALRRLNSLVLSSIGNEVSDGLCDINIGGTYDQSELCDTVIPVNSRLVLNLSAATSLALSHSPQDGQRLAYVDAADTLGTHSLTLDGNGRTIDGSSSLVLNTNGASGQFMYRADLADWVEITNLVEADQMPFPADFDDYFVTMLAMRLNPRHSATIDAASMEALKRSRRQLIARYGITKQVYPDVIRPLDTDRWGYYTSQSAFDLGHFRNI